MKKGIKFLYLPQPSGRNYTESLGPDPDYYDMLTNYITGNIMGSKRTCEELLQSIKEIEAGKLDEDERSGNVCSITINKHVVEINMSVGKGKIQETIYPLWIFKQAIEEWYDFLQTGREREIEFDYEPQEHEKTRYYEGVI